MAVLKRSTATGLLLLLLVVALQAFGASPTNNNESISSSSTSTTRTQLSSDDEEMPAEAAAAQSPSQQAQSSSDVAGSPPEEELESAASRFERHHASPSLSDVAARFLGDGTPSSVASSSYSDDYEDEDWNVADGAAADTDLLILADGGNATTYVPTDNLPPNLLFIVCDQVCIK